MARKTESRSKLLDAELKKLIEVASEDLQVAELTSGSSLSNQVCSRSNRCAEKSLVAERGESPPRTCWLSDLLTLLETPALDEVADELRLVEGFYISPRYPPDALLKEQETQEALTAARRVSEAIRGMGQS